MHAGNPDTIELALDGRNLKPESLWRIAKTALDPRTTWAIDFSADATERMQASAETVAKLVRSGRSAYGINTGFGHFAERRIPAYQLERLQSNLIRSHGCGVGQEVARDLVLALWLLRLSTLSRGFSGIRPRILGFFLALLRAGVLGCVPSRGSVGASGDLCPSAHAVLPILGEGICTRPNARREGFDRLPAAEILADLGLEPLPLGPKEGLALINGTQYTTALALKAWYEGRQLLNIANLAAAMSMEAMGAQSVLEEAVLRTHHPQTLAVGREMAAWLEGKSKGIAEDMRFLQAPYCLRCAPQVHGAVLLAIETGEATLTAELDAIGDNPLIFADGNAGEVDSCGNFHATYPARVSDSLATALTTLGSMSERRITMAMDERIALFPDRRRRAQQRPHDGASRGGQPRGRMPQPMHAGQHRFHSHQLQSGKPRADGSCCGAQGVASRRQVRNILAIELLAAAQALDLRRDFVMPPRLAAIHRKIRKQVPPLHEDRVLAPDLAAIHRMLEDPSFLDCKPAVPIPLQSFNGSCP